MNEHNIQNKIRLALNEYGTFFRANVGRGWVGDVISKMGGVLKLKNARPFSTGLPPGFSDLFGITPVTITPDMVGQTVGVFTAIEVKTPTGKVSQKQKNFIEQVKKNGGKAIVARGVDDLKLLR